MTTSGRGAAIEAARIQRAVGADGRRVFVKRFDTDPAALGCRLHAALSALLPAGIWSASPRVDAPGAMAREMRKSAAFRAAGIVVPDLVPAGPQAIASADAGTDAEAVLKRLKREGRAAEHDALLMTLAGSLGAIHTAGLCHGRPHPRDAALQGDGSVAWFDFEEEPEAAMALVDAQARDLWLLFLPICRRAIGPQTAGRALEAYRANAPADVARTLSVRLGLVGWMLPFARLLLKLHAGGDLRRFVGATGFLLDALAEPRPDVAPSDARWSKVRGLPTA